MDSASGNFLSSRYDANDGVFQILARLLSISKSTRALLYLKLSEIDFYNGQDELLLVFEDDDLLCVSTVAYRLNVRPSTVSKMVERLVQKNLLDRTIDVVDSRRTIVGLTPEGIEARSAVVRLRSTLENELFGHVDRENMNGVAKSLDLVEEMLRSKLAKLR